ncbi:MAG TPA: sulfatase-like hydrolase/transferase, partial [Vicinamibacterales bacterium]|nr:sulfatase-like hydrolase/transferase [Vicinamibacterales bacterium]
MIKRWLAVITAVVFVALAGWYGFSKRGLPLGVPLSFPLSFHHFERRPNVLLISIDTLRADHLGSYGYAGAQTPRLDALAAKGLR